MNIQDLIAPPALSKVSNILLYRIKKKYNCLRCFSVDHINIQYANICSIELQRNKIGCLYVI